MAIRLLSDNLTPEWTEKLMRAFALSSLQSTSIHYFEDQIKRAIKEPAPSNVPKTKKVKAKQTASTAHVAGMKKMTDFFKKKQ
jgi:hypothetical protein